MASHHGDPQGIELAVRDRREAAPTIAEDAGEGGSWEERLVDAEILERSLEGREAAETLKALRPREARYLALLAAGYSYAEIAEREGVTLTNVNKHLSRGALRARELREGGENGRRGA